MIITLCGSSKFELHFHAWNEALTLNGHDVFSLCTFPSAHSGNKNVHDAHPGSKGLIDAAQLRKVDLSDAVLLLNVGGYVGDSARKTFDYAKFKGKKLYVLESWGKDVITPDGFTIGYPTSHLNTVPWDLAPLRGGFTSYWVKTGYDPRESMGLL